MQRARWSARLYTRGGARLSPFTMLLALYYILGAAAPVVSSSVSVLVPLDEQLPLIARVDQPFSWSFSKNTFVSSTGGTLKYTASSLPDWLSFDSSMLSFHGTPKANDEGNPEITITAADSDLTASSRFTLCVTSSPAPTLRLPVEEQFHPDNPALASVFLLRPNSALSTVNPALRIPPKWSFSVGFQGSTFTSSNNLYYDALQSDGSRLPPWIAFNAKTITFDGFTPGEQFISPPQTLSLALHASDQLGYTASSLIFDLVIASRELSLISSLPTINLTASTSFNVSLSSPSDFHGVLVDGKAIQSSDIASLSIDTSKLGNWLKYDPGSMILSGIPPDDFRGDSSQNSLLPVTLTSAFNQTLHTNISFAVVPSFFSASDLDPILTGSEGMVDFNLMQYFSNATTSEQRDVNLTAAFEPREAGNYLNFDPGNAHLTGIIPAPSDSKFHIIVTFTAYSHVTHSTSHASLRISPSASRGIGHTTHLNNLSGRARKRLILGLAITFSIIGGVVLFGGLLAMLRCCARVPDTAVGGEEGKNVWTASDRKWYGIVSENTEARNASEYDRGYGWTENERMSIDSMEKAIDSEVLIDNPVPPPSLQAQGRYGDLGHGLRHVVSPTASNDPSTPLSPRLMKKAEFLGKLRETIRTVSRTVSDKYTRQRLGAKRLKIGKPTLFLSAPGSKVDGLPFVDHSPAPSTTLDPFQDIDSGRTSEGTSLTESPSSSTGGRSAPRRRADFGGEKSPRGLREPGRAYFTDSGRPRSHLGRQNSSDSFASNASARIHAAEAVVHTASRAMSVRSGVSEVSYQGNAGGAEPRPRLVPFTSASRVPVPRVPPEETGSETGSSKSPGTSRRIPSQTAKIFKSKRGRGKKKGDSVDDLNVSMQYVRALGGDQQATLSTGSNSAVFYPSTRTISTDTQTHSRSSFSSLASSHSGHRESIHDDVDTVTRRRVVVGDRLVIHVPVLSTSSQQDLDARLLSGKPLPSFLGVDWKGEQKGSVKFSGVPTEEDIGLLSFGVYEKQGGVCVARVIVDVIGISREGL